MQHKDLSDNDRVLLQNITECEKKLEAYSGNPQGKRNIQVALAKRIISLTSKSSESDDTLTLEKILPYNTRLIQVQTDLGFTNDLANSQHRQATILFNLGKLNENKNPDNALSLYGKALIAITEAMRLIPDNPDHPFYRNIIFRQTVQFHRASVDTHFIQSKLEMYKICLELGDNLNAAYFAARLANYYCKTIPDTSDDTIKMHCIENSLTYAVHAAELSGDMHDNDKLTGFYINTFRNSLLNDIRLEDNDPLNLKKYDLLIQMEHLSSRKNSPEYIYSNTLSLAFHYLKTENYKMAYSIICDLKISENSPERSQKLYTLICQQYADAICIDNPETAEKLYLEAIQYCNDKISLKKSYASLASIYFKEFSGQYDDQDRTKEEYVNLAISYYKMALEIGLPGEYENGVPHMLITTLLEYGRIQETLTRHIKRSSAEKIAILLSAAIFAYEAAIEYAVKYHEIRKLGSAYHRLAELYFLVKGENDLQAEKYYHKAIVHLLDGLLEENRIDHTDDEKFQQKLQALSTIDHGLRRDPYRQLREEIHDTANTNRGIKRAATRSSLENNSIFGNTKKARHEAASPSPYKSPAQGQQY